MVELDKISRIGFGCYRTSINSKEHYEALKYAIINGCNLIDTSSNYLNGESEQLVGKVIKENPKLFIITKAGYISDGNLKSFNEFNEKGIAKQDVVNISNDFKHSIHPDFLKIQIDQSLKRLNRSFIDAFLLHSPEYYFKQENATISDDEYYSRIKKAFLFLEQEVDKGRIRYYGISSNSFSYSINQFGATRLNKVIAIANEISSSNRFKFIQFPFNLIEKEAFETNYYEGKSLLTYAKENGLITLGNRPLNAKSKNGRIRLALYPDSQNFETGMITSVMGTIFEEIELQLKFKGIEENLMNFEVLNLLYNNWKKIDSEKKIIKIMHHALLPFLQLIFDNSIPEKVSSKFVELEAVLQKFSKNKMSGKTISYLKASGYQNHLNTNNLSRTICSRYLEMGLSHVLIGMKKKEYVNSMKKII